MAAARGKLLIDAGNTCEGSAAGIPPDDSPSVDGTDASVPASFAAWSATIRPRLTRLARRMLWNDADADELAQDALLLAWQKSDQIRETGCRDAWVCRTLINLCHNHRRRRHPALAPPADTLAGKQTVGGTLEQTELIQRVRVAMSLLPDRQHAAMVLRDMEEMPYEEVATILEISAVTARVLVHRARETVRQTLLNRWHDTFGTKS